MPRAKRFFPVSQRINIDPEIRRLKKDCGLAGFSMWLEILAQTDGKKGLWKGSEKDIGGVLAGVCESNTRGAARVLQYLTDLGWIVWLRTESRVGLEGVTEGVYNGSQRGSAIPLQPITEGVCDPSQRGSAIPHRWGLIVANYAEFHKTEGEVPVPAKDNVRKPSEPNQPNQPSPIPPSRSRGEPPLDGAGFDQFWELYPKKVDKQEAIKAWKKARIENGTREKIMESLQAHKLTGDWKRENGRFIPYPASWLNKRRWEDEVKPESGTKRNFWGG